MADGRDRGREHLEPIESKKELLTEEGRVFVEKMRRDYVAHTTQGAAVPEWMTGIDPVLGALGHLLESDRR